MTVITTPIVTIDQLVGGLDIGAPTLTAIMGANPQPWVSEELELDTGTKTASATTGAATLNKSSGVITSESLTTAAGSIYTLTLSNSKIAAGDMVFPSVQLGDSTTGIPQVVDAAVTAGQVVIRVKNIDGSAPFNGTIAISFMVLKAGAPA